MEYARLVIVGCGGLGKEILWAANRSIQQMASKNLEIAGFCSDNPEDASKSPESLPFLGVPKGDWLKDLALPPTHFICAIGDNKARKAMVERLEAYGLKALSIVDPAAIIAPDAIIGEGSFIAAQTVISVGAKVGLHVVINFQSSIGHDVTLENYSHVCPGARLSGGAHTGKGAFIGSNAVVNPLVSIGAWSTLGSSSMATRTIQANATAVGVPSRIVWPPSPSSDTLHTNISKDGK